MRVLIGLSILCLMAACAAPRKQAGVKRVDPDGYLAWFEDPANGMIVRAAADDSFVRFTSFYTSPDYELVSAMKAQGADNRRIVDSLRVPPGKGDTTDRYYFSVRISDEHDALKKLLNRNAKLQPYTESGMKDDFKLAICGDTLKPVFYFFENTLDIMPAATVLLVFEGRKRNACSMELFYDERLISFQTYRFLYPSDQLNKTPRIH